MTNRKILASAAVVALSVSVAFAQQGSPATCGYAAGSTEVPGWPMVPARAMADTPRTRRARIRKLICFKGFSYGLDFPPEYP